ncbi:zincin-like metallopeptidase domain-containing protein [Brucella intermedia]|uniref:Antirestriction protein ArdC n=1 Tax=Brucella daejeonensis TaxID=659015 RepID=A0A7W9EPE1_9HYPH|nr:MULTISPECIES: zincin-like metallopeptidase domain-containing protein [Brucella]MBB5704070.1 antirestriction protein ArdC [Brucella daejeonensis]MCO7728723.1 zincin-like metallopeptidase domain-containing protein [Brucella intermedia]NKB79530.1 DUF1738 domain-containing protein [Brucella daejeonensis]
MAKVTQKFDVYTEITNQIIAAIEKGADTFQMPWHRTGTDTMSPVNIDTGNAYRGINIVSLWAAAHVRDFKTGVWGTYRQWQNAGCQVRKGEKSAVVIFYKEFEHDDEDASDDQPRKRLMARASRVFNADQVDGYAPEASTPIVNQVSPIEAADRFITATKVEIRHGGESAYYAPATDVIQMPPREVFHGSATSTATEAYYSTLLHELVHFSGHESRCARLETVNPDKDAYAREELVAELGAAFLCNQLGVTLEPRPDHAAYISHWLKILKADSKAIFQASSLATKAVDFLKGLQA